MELRQVRVDEIDDKEFAMRLDVADPAFEELCSSVRRDGIIQPVILVQRDDRYKIAAGHRRTAAACANRLEKIPALVIEADDRAAWSIAFAENLFRKDLTPIEEAAAIKDCIESEIYTVETIAKMLNRSVGWVLNRLDMMNWPPAITQVIHAGLLSVAAARWIAKIGDETQIELLTAYAVENGATERTTQSWYQSYVATKATIVPEDIEPLPGAPKVKLPEPQSPCVICGNIHPMRELSYLPVCGGCGENLIQIAQNVQPVPGE